MNYVVKNLTIFGCVNAIVLYYIGNFFFKERYLYKPKTIFGRFIIPSFFLSYIYDQLMIFLVLFYYYLKLI